MMLQDGLKEFSYTVNIMKYKSITIIGPTASGKTALAHALSDALAQKNIATEIINLDAFQIYTEFSIGTAKPTLDEQIKYKYHCLNICQTNESMDANLYASLAHKACKEILERNAFPICVGGSGLYLRAFLHGLDDFPPQNQEIRQKIRQYAQENGWDKCYEKLSHIDPVRAKELHPNDHMRIERALEIFELTQTPVSQLQTKKDPLHNQTVNLDSFIIHIEHDNEKLKENIVQRTRQLFAAGWIEEVESLYKKYGDSLADFNAMRAIGYKAILDAIQSKQIHHQTEQLVQQIAHDTFKYAKRQKTWNKKEKKDFAFESCVYHSDIIAYILHLFL